MDIAALGISVGGIAPPNGERTSEDMSRCFAVPWKSFQVTIIRKE
jgi:hypothetical protein